MSGYGYKKKWLRAGKVLEYYIDGGPWANSIRDAEYQLYHAVIDGQVKAQVDGKPFDNLGKLRGKSFADDRPYVLPFDLELNIEDVERIWDWSKYDIADLLARGIVRPVTAEMRMEINNLNIETLLNRVRVRLAAMSLDKALEETEFKERWARLSREQRLLAGAGLVEAGRFSELLAEYKFLNNQKEELIDEVMQYRTPPKVRGRKPTYDWEAAAKHIAAQFEFHGQLSPDDPEWSCQAEIEREIKRFFLDSVGQEPATSTTRVKAKSLIRRYLAEKAEK